MTNFTTIAPIIISLISFAFSAYVFIFQLLKNRKNIHIEIPNYFTSRDRDILNLHIINKSREPICISRIYIESVDKKEFCGLYKERLGSFTFADEPTVRYKSDNLPQFISGLGFRNLILICPPKLVTLNHQSKIIFYTNKGLIKKKFTIDHYNESRNIFRIK